MDGRHKARILAGGHLIPVPLDSVYSGVVTLRGIRLTKLKNLNLWVTDVGNAYLEATKSEEVFMNTGDEFGKLSENFLIMHKALYQLCSSGKRWYKRLSD